MEIRNLSLPLFAALVALIAPATGTSLQRIQKRAVKNPVLFCYYGTWSKYSRLGAANIDPFICTHILASFGEISIVGSTATIKAIDTSDELDSFPGLVGLKKRNPSLKILLAIGGWNHGTERFRQVTDNAALLKSFTTNAVKYLKKFDFDGIDIDWEFPTNKNQFTKFIKALKTELVNSGNGHLILTSAMSAGEANIMTAYDIPALAPLFDYILLMAYDLHGAWEGMTGHNSPLFGRSIEQGWRARLNTAWAASEWHGRGMPREKIVIGMPTYARQFTLNDAGNNGVGVPAGWTNQVLAYDQVCKFLSGSHVFWDQESRAYYAVKNKLWLSFESVRAVTIKTDWLLLNNYAGAMVWTVDQDDYANRCGQGSYPLLRTIRQILQGKTDTGLTVRPFPDTPEPPATNAPGAGTPSTAKPPITTTIKIIVDGSVDCSVDPPGDYPINGECTAFIKCANGFEFISFCPPTLFYDHTKNWCSYEHEVKPNRPDCPWSGSDVTPPRTTTIKNPTTTKKPPTTTKKVITTTRITTTTTKPVVTTKKPDTTTKKPFITTKKPVTTTKKPTTIPIDVVTQVDCMTADTGNYPMMGDCTSFIQCVNGHRFENFCALGLFYDPENDRCDWKFIVSKTRTDCFL